MKIRSIIGSICLMFIVSCGQCNEPNNPVTRDYPCGTRAHMCSSGLCCWNNEDCGGDVLSCPKDMCCYAGGQWGISKDIVIEEHTMTKQWKP